MLKIIKYLVILFLIFIISSCSKNDDDIINPFAGKINFGDTTNAIFLSSFELNGNPSIQGWQPWDSLSTLKYSFSNNVPVGGGNWSLELRGGAYAKNSVEATLDLNPSDSLKNYVLSFWAIGKGQVIFSLDAPDRGVVGLPNINCTTWTFFADTLFRNSIDLNKLSILLTEGNSDSLAYVLYDNVKVVVSPH